MLTSLYPWDYRSSHFGTTNFKSDVTAIFTFDSYMEHMVLEDCKKKFSQGRVLLKGEQLSIDWAMENLGTLSLFAEDRLFIILESENIPKATVSILWDRFEKLSQEKIIFFFSASTPFYQALCANKEGLAMINQGLEIVAPRFWEFPLVLRFLLGYFKMDSLPLQMSQEAQEFLLSSLEAQFSHYYETLAQIKVWAEQLRPPRPLLESDLAPLISKNHLDQFELADLYSQKKFQKFFKIILDAQASEETLRSFFCFMQGHLLKMIDPQSIQAKKKISQYEKKIIQTSAQWSSPILLRHHELFKSWECLAKAKNSQLYLEIRQKYFSILNRTQQV